MRVLQLEELVVTRRQTWELACNWKLFVENAMEEYHIGTVHRQTIQKNTPVETHAAETPNGRYAILYSKHEGTMALLKGDTGFPRIETLRGKPAEGTYFVMVYPCTMFAFTPIARGTSSCARRGRTARPWSPGPAFRRRRRRARTSPTS